MAAAVAEEQPVGVVLVGGGARSGKSRFALEYAEKRSRRPAFVATGEARDDEMRERIERHQRERAAHWTTIEEPLDLTAVVEREASRFDLLVVDCLTLWLSNVLLHPERDARNELRGLAECLKNWRGPALVLITNEVGLGIVPESPLAREFRDLAGEMNQAAASAAEEVYWMVFGVPMMVKGPR
jgi:adenosylcobinamide kinase/adenosylcobinamide-phosphate guanylyltransferase